jgi:fatty-acyl-CoA synthase
MRVTVTLSKDNKSSLAKLETELADFLFEAQVQVG